MKKIVLSAMLLFAGVTAANAQCSGNVGCQSGSSVDLVATATGSGTHVVCFSNSLCGSTGLRAKVLVNGHVVFNTGNWNGQTPSFNANAGDVIEVIATTKGVDRDIVCVWAGEITACISTGF